MSGPYQVYIMKGKEVKRVIVFAGDGENPERIHIDDTIAQIKNKIIRELEKNGETAYSSNHLYLCAEVSHQINLSNITLSQHPRAFEQLLINLDLEYPDYDPLKKHGVQDLILTGLKHGEMRPIMVGLGMKQEPFDYVFPADHTVVLPTTNFL